MAKKRRPKKPGAARGTGKARKTGGRKTISRKKAKSKPRARRAKKVAGTITGGAMPVLTKEGTARGHWPYEWVDEIASGQWCYDSRDVGKTKLGEWKLRPGEHPFPYKCRVGIGDEWGEANSAAAREAIIKKIQRGQREMM